MAASTAATLLCKSPRHAFARNQSSSGAAQVRELKLASSKAYRDPFWDVQVDVLVTAPDGGEQLIPAFWSGGSQWRWRFSTRKAGLYRYKTISSDTGNPCVVGCWGYYLPKLGMKKMQAHWRTIIARWGAHPVVWCLAGEGSMPWYLSDRKSEERAELEEGWTVLARFVRQTDPFQRLRYRLNSKSVKWFGREDLDCLFWVRGLAALLA